MSRLHVHLHVRDLDHSVGFYSKLFGANPTRLEPGYAKWMLEDPRVNFAISTGGEEQGLSHLGIQADSDAELVGIADRARDAAGEVLVERNARCCYAVGNKAWATDPQGMVWEAFHSTGALKENEEGADAIFIEHEDGSRTASPSHAACGCAANEPAKKAKAKSCCAA